MKEETKAKIIFGLSGLVGGLIAIIADVCQKGDNSSFQKMVDVFATRLGLPFSLPIVAFVVLGIATILPLIFDRKNKAESFYTGASVLAIMMTIMPGEIPLSVSTAGGPPASEIMESVERPQTADKARMSDVFPVKAIDRKITSTFTVRLTGDGTQGITDGVASLIDIESGRVANKIRFSGNSFSFYQLSGRYLLTVEAVDFARHVQSVSIGEDDSKKLIAIDLKKSSMPMTLQRLIRR